MSRYLLFSTQHLLIENFDISDAPFIVELVNTPGWLRFIGDRNIHTTKEAEDYLISGSLRSYKEDAFGLWRVRLKDGPSDRYDGTS